METFQIKMLPMCVYACDSQFLPCQTTSMGDPLDGHIQACPKNEIRYSEPWKGLEKHGTIITTRFLHDSKHQCGFNFVTQNEP
jgi:hypothetical protein